jgi:hypothetical protein
MLLKQAHLVILAPFPCGTARILATTHFNRPLWSPIIDFGDREKSQRIGNRPSVHRHFSQAFNDRSTEMPPNGPRIPDARERYSNDHLFPKFRGVGPQDAEKPARKSILLIMGFSISEYIGSINISTAGLPPFEIPTLTYFLLAAPTGNFPGQKTELPLWPDSEMQYFRKKYSE